ncbi:Velvet complex subunit B [Colletotrichum trifolii]|uniref:Velvet complex subunit B n=1 Tax=Colletotrichum trifolii TaxID=5466 RepID=A0A4R8PR22_COLTR|nr:Velvet complex subunit B [Colletotrichum trifolii]
MNYDQHNLGGYHHMPPTGYSQQLPPPPQHLTSAAPQQHPQHHHSHPSNQMPPLPPMPLPHSAPIPSHMASNGLPQHLASSGPGGPPAAQVPAPAHKNGPLPQLSKVDDIGRQYRLEVLQQPQRARMCGFGDKDRRPITPPPCIRVVVFDPKTNQEVHVNDLEFSHFICNVDLWSEDGSQEVNLVRHSSSTASISTTVPYSFQHLRDDTQPIQPMYPQIMPNYGGAAMPYGQQHAPAPGQPHMMPGAYGGMTGYQPPTAGYQSTNSAFAPPTQYYPQHPSATVPSQADMGGYGQRQSVSIGSNQPQGMFTRNLIGSLASSASRLADVEDKLGIWFVMQDLSVRTEGLFRLRFSFVSVAKRPNQPHAVGGTFNMGKSPVLAQCFSDVFQVYSAKKFPGVCESTPLSRCFATQGIKIPIRKDGLSEKKGNNDEDEDF